MHFFHVPCILYFLMALNQIITALDLFEDGLGPDGLTDVELEPSSKSIADGNYDCSAQILDSNEKLTRRGPRICVPRSQNPKPPSGSSDDKDPDREGTDEIPRIVPPTATDLEKCGSEGYAVCDSGNSLDRHRRYFDSGWTLLRCSPCTLFIALWVPETVGYKKNNQSRSTDMLIVLHRQRQLFRSPLGMVLSDSYPPW